MHKADDSPRSTRYRWIFFFWIAPREVIGFRGLTRNIEPISRTEGFDLRRILQRFAGFRELRGAKIEVQRTKERVLP